MKIFKKIKDRLIRKLIDKELGFIGRNLYSYTAEESVSIINYAKENGVRLGDYIEREILIAWDKNFKYGYHADYRIINKYPIGNTVRDFLVLKEVVFFEIEGYLYHVYGFGDFRKNFYK
ncbi:MAG: hypothetical protein WC720_05105 [Candidatus Shapirobacteria bacterium]|jgi:hypothetical protein